MLKVSDAIVIDENFGPKPTDERANMPALEAANM